MCLRAAAVTAFHAAAKSVEQYRLGAVLCEGTRVVAQGWNRNVNACGLPSIHAEMDALWKAGKQQLRHPHLVVIRISGKTKTLRLSKPCRACEQCLRRKGVRRVTYSTGNPHEPYQTLYL